MEKGIITNSTQERLMKLENEKAILEDKVEYEQNHQIKPLEKEQIVNFLKVYARKQFDNKTDKNEFFNNFILKVLLCDDKITIVYNTSLNPAEEIYSRPNDNDDDNNNSNNETTIYKKEIEISDEENKKLPFEFKRQLFGGRRAPAFEPYSKTKAINPEKGEVETEIDKAETVNKELKFKGRKELNTNIESNAITKSKQTAKPKTKSKATPPTIQKFSNHIKFIDFIPTHEIITYRHLFAYGFYVE